MSAGEAAARGRRARERSDMQTRNGNLIIADLVMSTVSHKAPGDYIRKCGIKEAPGGTQQGSPRGRE
jgi:hypothetical protein